MVKHAFVQIFLMILFNIWLTNGISVVYEKHSNQIVGYADEHQVYSCQRTMTLKQIVRLLRQQPCAQIFGKQNKRQLNKRNTDAGNVDIHALQTTINDHRTMINYLVNNSINATYVSDAISTHHSKTGPILSSWRDLIDLFTIALFFGLIIYYCICRAGFTPCDKVISFFFKPVITRTQQQQQQQEQQQEQRTAPAAIIDQPVRRKPTQSRRGHSSMASIDGDIVRFNNGYMSE